MTKVEGTGGPQPATPIPMGKYGMERLGGDSPHRGRFAPGHKGGPGRQKGIDLRKLAEERSEKSGMPLADRLWAVLEQLFAQAMMGDVNAAKLILDKLAQKDPEGKLALAVAVDLPPQQRVERVRQLLDSARERQQEERQRVGIQVIQDLTEPE